jgi:hypothetical protein
MPSINRTSIIAGPALIQFSSQKFWSKGNVEIKIINDRFNVDTAHFGKVDERYQDRRIEVTFEPSGAITTALAAVIFPYGSTNVGTSIFTGTDRPLEIFGRDGRKITVHAAAVTKMPPMRLGATSTLLGSMTFTGIVKNSTDPTNATAYYTEAAVAYPGDTGFAVSDIKTAAASAAWGAAAPWSSFVSENGFEIDFNLAIAPQKVDGIGTVDMTFTSLEVMCKAIPVGPAATDILARISPTSGLGASMASADNLIVTAGTVAVAVSKPALTESGLIFGSQAKRIGSTTWSATRTITAAVADPLFTVTVS